MTKKQVSRTQVNWLLSFALLIAAVIFLWFWYNQSYLKPSSVFWGTISNNLNTGFVTRTSSQTQGAQRLTQINDLQFTPELLARSIVRLENTETNEKVVTETIGTPTADYLRYVEIDSEQSRVTDNSAIGSWAKREAGQNTQPQILTDALLGNVLMFGDLSKSDRKQLVDDLQKNNAFQKYDIIKKKTVGGQRVYTYNVVLNLDAYANIYKTYLKMLGQEKLAEQIGAQQSGATYQFELDVIAASRVPLKLSVPDSENAEYYSNIGARQPIAIPQTNQTISELQAKLSGN